MKAVQFQKFGTPEVLEVVEAPEPHPGPGQIRVKVYACGVNPADWALVDGLFSEHLPPLPRSIGCEASGIVDELGEGVSDVALGDRVFGPATYDGPTAGAAEFAVLSYWVPVPDGLDLLEAAALPMVVETAWRALDDLGLAAGELLLVHGAGSSVGGAAVRLALRRGARVIATAGSTRAPELEALGVKVTTYGDGMAERVAELADGAKIDRALDAAPLGRGELATLVEITGEPDRVLTASDFETAEKLGTRSTIGRDLPYHMLDGVAQLAAEGEFRVPIARTFALDQIGEAATLSSSGHPGGKVMLAVSPEAVAAAA